MKTAHEVPSENAYQCNELHILLWDLNPWLCCYIFLFFLIIFLMLSGVLDNPDRPNTCCPFRRMGPKQRPMCRKKKFGNQMQVLKEAAAAGLGSPQTFDLSRFCSTHLPEGNSVDEEVCRKLTPLGTRCSWLWYCGTIQQIMKFHCLGFVIRKHTLI